MLVKEPSFSTYVAAGRKKTSVAMSCGFHSPSTTSGPSFQNDAESIITLSRTTSHSRLANPLRCMRPFAVPMAGFSPHRK